MRWLARTGGENITPKNKLKHIKINFIKFRVLLKFTIVFMRNNSQEWCLLPLARPFSHVAARAAPLFPRDLLLPSVLSSALPGNFELLFLFTKFKCYSTQLSALKLKTLCEGHGRSIRQGNFRFMWKLSRASKRPQTRVGLRGVA